MPFYEYYFEPAGKNGMVTFQFMHEDYESGMKAKNHIESLINLAQYIFIILFILSLLIFSVNKVLGILMLIIVGSLFNTRFLNPMGVQYQQWKATKQLLFT
jgi:hypothetical protein